MDFYYMPGSAPSRAVQMVATAIGANLNLKYTNLGTGEHKKPEFTKINPQQTLPTLVDGDFILWESRAIIMYLIEKFGHKGYYPESPKIRGLINQRFYFDMGTLYKTFAEYYYPQLFYKQPAVPEKLEAFKQAMVLLNGFLEGHKYIVGDNLTIADFSLTASISTFDAAGFDLSPYPNVVKYWDLCKKTLPGYALNEVGIAEFKKMVGK